MSGHDDTGDDADRLLKLIKGISPEASKTADPGIVMRRPDWLRPWDAAEARKERISNPLLAKHLRGVVFASFTSDEAGIAAWERAGQDVVRLQEELPALTNAKGEIINPDARLHLSDDPPSGPNLRRGN